MLNHVGRYDWSLHNDALRPSVLGRAASRKAHVLEKPSDGSDDPEEAPRSAETTAKQHQALRALWSGDVGAHAASLDAVIHSWRKDNAAGGRGVFEHLPLPNDLARSMARVFDQMDRQKKQPAFDALISRLDPSVRAHVAQQVAGSMQRISLADAHYSARPPADSPVGRQLAEDLSRTNLKPYAQAITRSTPDDGGRGGRMALALRDEIEGREGTIRGPARAAVERDHVVQYVPSNDGDRRGLPRNRGGGQAREVILPAIPMIVGWIARERLIKAAKSAAYSAGADIVVSMAANSLKPRDKWEYPDWRSVLISGAQGAASGFVDLSPVEPWKLEAGIAVLGSLVEDMVTAEEGKEAELNYWGAIGAGVGAGLWGKYGKERFRNKFGSTDWSQASGKLVSKLIKEVFAVEVEFLSQEALKLFMEGFSRFIENADAAMDYLEQQFNDWFWQDDRDPTS
jgi:hypothetical protein